MSIQSRIQIVLTKYNFNYSSLQVKANGAVLIRRLLTADLPDYETIITLARAMIFKPLQRDSWILAELLGTAQNADEREAVAYWVQTNLQGEKEAVFLLYPDAATITRTLSKTQARFSEGERVEITAALNLVEAEAEIGFSGNMATIEVELSGREPKRIVHEIIAALGTHCPIYERGLAWFAITGHRLTIQLYPCLSRVRYSLRRQQAIEQAQAKRKLGNWHGHERAELLAQAVKMLRQGLKIGQVATYFIERYYSGNGKEQAARKFKQSLSPFIPAPKRSPSPNLAFALC